MNRNSIVIGAAVVLALSAVFPQAHAQKKMYRCGSNYQDRPCDAAPAPAAAKPAPQQASVPVAEQRAAYQKKLRCENYGRQVDELHDKQKAVPKDARLYDAQIKSLETRMKGDSC